MKRFLYILLASAIYPLLAGCDGNAAAAPTPAPAPSARSIIVIEAEADSIFQPALPDDFDKTGDAPETQSNEVPAAPQPGDSAPESPDKTLNVVESPVASQVASPVVFVESQIILTGYSLGKTCAPCVKSKVDMAAVERSTNGRVKLVMIEDQSKFPKWLKELLKKNDALPADQQKGFPFIEWRNSSGWHYSDGWTDLLAFAGKWNTSAAKPPQSKPVVKVAAPPAPAQSRPPLFYNKHQHQGHWTWPSDLRQHLTLPPHNYSQPQIDTMPDSQVIQTHDAWHNKYGSLDKPKRLMSAGRAWCPT